MFKVFVVIFTIIINFKGVVGQTSLDTLVASITDIQTAAEGAFEAFKSSGTDRVLDFVDENSGVI